jgi:hypothetical protein
MILRQPVPAQPALPLSSFGGGRPEHTVTFKHPGYPDQFSQNILLTLHAFDDVRGGLHYKPAHIACAIVACNAWNKYFSRTRNGSDGLNLQHDDLIFDKVLYFHVRWSDAKHPVYLDFAKWAFPHDDLPSSWPRAPASDEDALDTDELRAPLHLRRSRLLYSAVTKHSSSVARETVSNECIYARAVRLTGSTRTEWRSTT